MPKFSKNSVVSKFSKTQFFRNFQNVNGVKCAQKNKPALWQVFSPCQISKNNQETQFLRNFTFVHTQKITYETKTRANPACTVFASLLT